MVAAAIGLSAAAGLAGSALSSSASSKASDNQTAASTYAANLQQQRYDQTRSDLLPYNDAGQSALGYAKNDLAKYADNGSAYLASMQDNLPSYNMWGVENSIPGSQNNSTVPGSMSQSELEATPGYQFTRDQGLKGVASSAAARGLGVSGAALKGAATYATGLADNTYQTQFNIKQQQFSDQLSKDNQNFNQGQTQYSDLYNTKQGQFNQKNQIYSDIQNLGQSAQNWSTNAANRLSTVASLGENAAAQTGNYGTQAATNAGNYLVSGANAAGASGIAGANSLSSGLNSAANSLTQSNTLNKLLSNNNSGSSTDSAYQTYFGNTSSGSQVGSQAYQAWGGEY